MSRFFSQAEHFVFDYPPNSDSKPGWPQFDNPSLGAVFDSFDNLIESVPDGIGDVELYAARIRAREMLIGYRKNHPEGNP